MAEEKIVLDLAAGVVAYVRFNFVHFMDLVIIKLLLLHSVALPLVAVFGFLLCNYIVRLPKLCAE